MTQRQELLQVEHPDRVVWYQSLVGEWSSQTPGVQQEDDGQVVAWVGPYTSQAGMRHPEPTGVRALTVEAALEQLANDLYADLQRDLAYLRQMSVTAMPVPQTGAYGR
jgi:hypothetical protein